MPTDRPGRSASGQTKLQAALDLRGLDQGDLARMTGLDRRAINKICTGKVAAPHLGIVTKISRALELPVADLFDLESAEAAFDRDVSVQREKAKARQPRTKRVTTRHG